MNRPHIQIEFGPNTRALLDRLHKMPGEILAAMAQGMNKAAGLTVRDIERSRLTGHGPFPSIEGRLGNRTNRLRDSMRATAAVQDGDGLSLTIGTNLKYAAVHEFGAVYRRTTKPGRVRLAVDKNGNLIKRGNLATFAGKRMKARVVAYPAGSKEYEVHIPARAPIGHGVADNAGTFTLEIDSAIAKVVQ